MLSRHMPSRTPFSPEQEQRVLGAILRFKPRDRLAIILGLNTGYRASELAAITVGDVWDGNEVAREVTVQRRHLKGGRGARRDAVRSRTVPLNSAARLAITTYLEYRRQRCAGPITPAEPLLRSIHTGAGITRWRLNVLVHRATVAAGLEGAGRFGTHTLRKSFCRKVHEACGRDINMTRVAMGHSHVTTTQKYLEPDLDKIRSAILAFA